MVNGRHCTFGSQRSYVKENSQLTFPSGSRETILYSKVAAVSVAVSFLAIMLLNALNAVNSKQHVHKMCMLAAIKPDRWRLYQHPQMYAFYIFGKV